MKNQFPYYIILLLLLTINACTSKEQSADQILTQSLKASKALQNGTYKFASKKLYSGEKQPDLDTLEITFSKVENDEISSKLGFNLLKHRVEIFYDTKNSFFISRNDSTVIKYDIEKDGTRHLPLNIIFNDYFQSDSVRTLKRNKAHEVLLANDTIIQSKVCFNLRYLYKDDTTYNVTEKVEEVYIEKSSYLPIGSFESSKYNGVYNYDKFEVLSSDFNNKQYDTFFDKPNIPEYYTITNYEKREREKIKKLQVGDKTNPDLKLNWLHNDQPVQFAKEDKLMLLDFWYIACPPCTKAAPYINDFYNEYHDKGLKVVAINSHDDNEEALSEYLKNKKINYPIALDPPRTTTKKLGIQAFPSFILLNPKGEIVYRGDGFSKEIMDELKTTIEAHI